MSEIDSDTKNTEQHNVHKDQTDQLLLIEVGNEFVQGSDHRRHLFGDFLPTD